jgi:histidinol-phosphate aminotransferase
MNTLTNFNLDVLLRSNIKSLQPYRSARDEYNDFTNEMIYLDANENPFSNGMNRYPDPHQRLLKQAILEKTNLKEQNLLIGNGSDEVLDLMFRAFCEPKKDQVIVLPPTYGMYEVLAQLNEVETQKVCLTENFNLDVNAILAQVQSNTKMIFLCSPNNPTGNVFDDDSILKIISSFQGLVVLDEAYIDFSSQESWREAVEVYPNLIVVQTLSKAYGMAGLRIGLMFASSEIIQVIQRIKPPYNVNQLSQEVALKKLKQNSIPLQIRKIIKERNRLSEFLASIFWVQKVFPSEANFILIQVDDAAFRYRQFLNLGVVVRNRDGQPRCNQCLRISIGTPEENEKLMFLIKNNMS